MALGKITVENDYQLNLTAPPDCRECGTKMKAFNDHSWTCTNKECRCYGIAKVVPGVYPFKPLPAEVEAQVRAKRARDGE